MPRRTNSPRGRTIAKFRKVDREVERELSYDELARRLVESGACSPRILGPIPTYTHGHRGQDPREGEI